MIRRMMMASLNSSTSPPVERVFDVGTGSGSLIIDGTDDTKPWFPLQSNDKFIIADGSYDTLTVQNIDMPIIVEGQTKVGVIFEDSVLTNTKGLTLQKMSVIGATAEGIVLSSLVEDLTIQDCIIKDIPNYCIYLAGQAINYPTVAAKNVKLLNLEVENCGNIYFRGEFNLDGTPIDTGYVDGFEMAYCLFKNSDNVGTLLSLDNAENYEVHHNTVDSINLTVVPGTLHARLFFLKGIGNAYNNKATNYYGNLIAQWLFTRGSTPATTKMYNNIGFNSQYYSLLEVQTPAYYIGTGTTFANPHVFYNTACQMGQYPGIVQGDNFAAVVVDIYSLMGGTPKIENNVGIDVFAEGNEFRGWNFVINPSGYEGDIDLIQNNNLPLLSTVSAETQYNSYTDAGLENTTTFKPVGASPLLNAGVPVAGVNVDYYDLTRSATTPSIGAVE